MKNYIVTAQLFWSADHIEKFGVRCNTARKAEVLAKRQIWAKYPDIGNMIKILKVEEDENMWTSSLEILNPYEAICKDH